MSIIYASPLQTWVLFCHMYGQAIYKPAMRTAADVNHLPHYKTNIDNFTRDIYTQFLIQSAPYSGFSYTFQLFAYYTLLCAKT